MFVIVFICPAVLVVGQVAAALASCAPKPNEHVHAVAMALFSFLFSALLAVIPRGPMPCDPYSAVRAVSVEFARSAAILCGIASAIVAQASGDPGNVVACGASTLATFLAFVYCRLDDQLQHAWSCCDCRNRKCSCGPALWDLEWCP